MMMWMMDTREDEVTCTKFDFVCKEGEGVELKANTVLSRPHALVR